MAFAWKASGLTYVQLIITSINATIESGHLQKDLYTDNPFTATTSTYQLQPGLSDEA